MARILPGKAVLHRALLGMLALALAPAAEALAHGGSHPTPWPSPPPGTPGSPVPVPTPGRTPSPGLTPQAPEEIKWKTWWEINKWRFTWTPQRASIATSGEGGAGSDRLIDFLVKGLDHKYFDVRAAAAIALGRAGGKAKEKGLPRLQAMTQDQNGTAAESALLALGMLKSLEAVPTLLGVLTSSDKDQRRRTTAAVALGLIGDDCAASPMVELIKKPRVHDQVKAGCMMGLALMKHEPAAEMLLQYMMNPSMDSDLRAMAATALGKMGFSEVGLGGKKANVLDFLMKILCGETRERQLQLSAIMAVSALGPSGEWTSDRLVEVLGKLYAAERNTDVKSCLLLGMAELALEGKAQEKARRMFRSVLKAESDDQNPGHRALRMTRLFPSQSLAAFASLASGLSNDRESINYLRNLFKSKSHPDLLSAAAVALGLLKDVESTQMLLDAISGRGQAEFRGYCCIALGLMGARDNKEALPKLRQILNEGSLPELKAAAAMALALLGDADAVKDLQKAAVEGNAYIKMSILLAIGYFRDTSTVPGLIELFESEDSVNDETRAIILTALGYIAEESETPVLKQLATHYNFLLAKYDALLQIVKLL